MDERRMAMMMNVGRTAIGLALLAPRPVRRYLFGEEVETAVGRMLRRMTAARELALGLATIQAARQRSGVRELLQWGVFVDAVDSAAAIAGRGVPASGRLPLAFLAPAYTAVGTWLATRTPDTEGGARV